MESIYTMLIFAVLLGILAVPYWIRVARQRREAEEKLEKNVRGGLLVPVTLHPHIDVEACIGCGSCVKVCPESVLGLVQGRAAIVSGLKCVGHALCADVCPVGAIEMGFGTPKEGQEIPWYDDNHQTNIPGLFIIGELGGIGLIRNAVKHAKKAVEAVNVRPVDKSLDVDVLIVGAGPAGLTAALAAQEKGLRYVVLEQDSIGGTIYHYPRQKLILTAPVELPLYGKLKVSEISKEELLGIWQGIVKTYRLIIESNRKVESIEQAAGGFRIKAGDRTWTSGSVILALGRRGSPRKLGVKGEELSKVAYKLIEAESYQSKQILVVGGGDSAVEAAVALARQKGNTVTISYRRESFMRLKEKNEKHINDLTHAKKIRVIFNSTVEEITPDEAVVKESNGTVHRLKNEYVFVFAGGELPTQLLKSAGVRLRTADVEAAAA
jgi:thioredoxin reductase (NADPH)